MSVVSVVPPAFVPGAVSGAAHPSGTSGHQLQRAVPANVTTFVDVAGVCTVAAA